MGIFSDWVEIVERVATERNGRPVLLQWEYDARQQPNERWSLRILDESGYPVKFESKHGESGIAPVREAMAFYGVIDGA